MKLSEMNYRDVATCNNCKHSMPSVNQYGYCMITEDSEIISVDMTCSRHEWMMSNDPPKKEV